MRKKLLIFTFLMQLVFFQRAIAEKPSGDFYEIKIFHLKNNEQVNLVDQYLKNAYIPALHRISISNIGVFKPIGNDTSSIKSVYVLIPFKSSDAWMKSKEMLAKDNIYLSSAKSFLEAPADKPPYERIESILMKSLPGQPHLLLPLTKNPERVFELRSYESPTQHLSEKKMAMFNTGGEINIFKRLGFNPVFYGKVVSGSRMPNFMYMPVFESVQQRDDHWKIFGSDAQWKKISSDPENENNVSVSHIDSILMHSTKYSDY